MRLTPNRVAFALSALVLLVAPGTPAWMMGAHAYMAYRITGDASPAVVWGANAPDIGAGLRFADAEAGNHLMHLMHYKLDALPEGPFKLGFLTHNNVWGADRYAHDFLRNPDGAYWLSGKVRQLRADLGLGLGECEELFDTVMDFLIWRDHGQELGRLLIAGAEGGGHEDAMAAAYGPLLCERMPGLEPDQAAALITRGCRGLRVLAGMYGRELLAQNEAEMRRQYGQIVAVRYEISFDEALRRFDHAVALCESDFEQGIAEAVEGVRAALVEKGVLDPAQAARAALEEHGFLDADATR